MMKKLDISLFVLDAVAFLGLLVSLMGLTLVVFGVPCGWLPATSAALMLVALFGRGQVTQELRLETRPIDGERR